MLNLGMCLLLLFFTLHCAVCHFCTVSVSLYSRTKCVCAPINVSDHAGLPCICTLSANHEKQPSCFCAEMVKRTTIISVLGLLRDWGKERRTKFDDLVFPSAKLHVYMCDMFAKSSDLRASMKE